MYSDILQYKLFLNFYFINIMELNVTIINEKLIKWFSVFVIMQTNVLNKAVK